MAVFLWYYLTQFFILCIEQDQAELLHLLCGVTRHILYSSLRIKNVYLSWFYLKSNFFFI
jgi:hypothetical protein